MDPGSFLRAVVHRGSSHLVVVGTGTGAGEAPADTAAARPGAHRGAAVIPLRGRAGREHLRAEAAAARLEARTDYLTSLGNSRALAELLDGLERDESLATTPVSVLFVDVDHFAHYDHHQGREAGDAALRLLGRVLEDVCLGMGRPYRSGGDEFVVPLVGVGESGAADLAERVRAAVVRLAVPHPGAEPVGVLTVTVGVATAPGSSPARTTLYGAARAMTDGKDAGGRNRVHAAPALRAVGITR